MLAITVRLLHGTIRAGLADDTTTATSDTDGEWPPSPARLFSAFVAADGTGERCRVTDGSELLALESLGAPAIHADASVEQTSLRPRYVIIDAPKEGMAQDYPGRRAAEVHPGTRMSPRTPTIHYVWPHDIGAPDLSALKLRAARIGYFGCADSPVHVSVDAVEPADLTTTWIPGEGATELPVAYSGFLDELDRAFDQWSAGNASRRSWIPTRRERYGVPVVSNADTVEQPTVVWLSLDKPLASWKVLKLTETLRAAVIDHADRLADDGPLGRRSPWQLHGHSIPDHVQPPYQLVRYLALPNVGHEQSDGAIHGAAVWIPPRTDPAIIELIRASLGQIKHLTSSAVHVDIAVREPTGGKWSTRPTRWAGPSRQWFSATPAVAERGRRSGPSLSDVQAWFTHAGHPAPTIVRVSTVPTMPGVTRLSGVDVHRSNRDRHPFYWLDVEFAEPVTGPMCVGRNRSFGLGLLAPMANRQLGHEGGQP